MRPFIDDREDNNSDDIGFKITNSYIEMEIPMSDTLCAVLYMLPRNESSIYIAACWEHCFDDLLDNIDNDGWDVIVTTWPTLALLLSNGLNDRYREGSLIRFEDVDYGEQSWFVVSISGNLDFESLDSLLNDRTQETMKVVLEKSLTLLIELRENRPSLLRAMGKGFAKGALTAIGLGIAAAFGIEPELSFDS